MTWKINSSEHHQVDRFNVTVDQVIVPNGKERKFSYIDIAKGVCVLPITNDNHILCLRQYRHAIKSWQWELPAGMIDLNGVSALDTAEKELVEETGFIAEEWLELGSFYPSPGSTTEEIFLFAAAGLTKSEQKLEISEQIEVHKISMEKLKTLIKSGEFQHGAGLAAILRYVFTID